MAGSERQVEVARTRLEERLREKSGVIAVALLPGLRDRLVELLIAGDREYERASRAEVRDGYLVVERWREPWPFQNARALAAQSGSAYAWASEDLWLAEKWSPLHDPYRRLEEFSRVAADLRNDQRVRRSRREALNGAADAALHRARVEADPAVRLAQILRAGIHTGPPGALVAVLRRIAAESGALISQVPWEQAANQLRATGRSDLVAELTRIAGDPLPAAAARLLPVTDLEFEPAAVEFNWRRQACQSDHAGREQALTAAAAYADLLHGGTRPHPWAVTGAGRRRLAGPLAELVGVQILDLAGLRKRVEQLGEILAVVR